MAEELAYLNAPRRMRRALTPKEVQRLLYAAPWRPLAEYGPPTIRQRGSERRANKGRRATWRRAALTLADLPAAVAAARQRPAVADRLVGRFDTYPPSPGGPNSSRAARTIRKTRTPVFSTRPAIPTVSLSNSPASVAAAKARPKVTGNSQAGWPFPLGGLPGSPGCRCR